MSIESTKVKRVILNDGQLNLKRVERFHTDAIDGKYNHETFLNLEPFNDGDGIGLICNGYDEADGAIDTFEMNWEIPDIIFIRDFLTNYLKGVIPDVEKQGR